MHSCFQSYLTMYNTELILCPIISVVIIVLNPTRTSFPLSLCILYNIIMIVSHFCGQHWHLAMASKLFVDVLDDILNHMPLLVVFKMKLRWTWELKSDSVCYTVFIYISNMIYICMFKQLISLFILQLREYCWYFPTPYIFVWGAMARLSGRKQQRRMMAKKRASSKWPYRALDSFLHCKTNLAKVI